MKRILGLRRPGAVAIDEHYWFWRPFPGTEPIGEEFTKTVTAVGTMRSIVLYREGTEQPLWSAMYSAMQEEEPELVTEEVK